MPKRSKQINQDLAPAKTESFEPYWTAILIIVMGTFTLYGIQLLTTATHAMGVENVASCFAESKEAAFHRFVNCTDTIS